MMTKKTMTILSVFMIVALTAVGFAAWLIVGTIDAETQGSFVSNELKDKYFKVEVNFDNDGEVDEEKGDIIFGRPTTDYVYADGSWLSYSNRDAKQKLSATATVKFIPDDGFLVDDDDNTENRDMKYYLEKIISEGETEADDDKQYRTVRVVIDIFDVIGEGATDNYKWFDMAVQLGYIQYPTAEWINPSDEADAENIPLSWGKIEEGEVVPLTEETDLENINFENNFLYIDLSYDMFVIDSGNAYATANIQIDFAWGEAVATGEGEERVYNNPYTYFDELNPEDPATVLQYLDAANKKLVAVNTTDYDDPETTDVVEGYENVDAKTIRNKDLAQRMLDYLRDYLNYVPADDTADPAVKESGIQFSITLLEGEPDAE